jgi:hypothetical protein
VIPEALAGFAEDWDDEAAKSLFLDCLRHQATCYGLTYAAIPPPAMRRRRASQFPDR